MRKILAVAFLIVFLCGCETQDSEYLISSIGFDYNQGIYEVCFETIVVNSEETKQTLKLIEGYGKTIEEAVDMIEKQCTKPLLISHCGVIVVGEKMKRKELLKVCDFCYQEEEITISAFLIKTESPKKLLSAKPLASACVGYDIMGLLKQNKAYDNRFFDIIKSDYDFNLPKISLKQGGLIFDN